MSFIEGADQERIDGLTKNTEQEKNEDNHSSKEEDSKYSETDEENEFSTNGQFSRAASSSTSAYSEHLNHILSGDEVETLTKDKRRFKWEAPAHGMPNCSWKGTRPNFLGVCNLVI